MRLVGPPDSMNSINGTRIADETAEGIAGVCRISDQASWANDLYGRGDKPRLRISGMDFEQSGHARILGKPDN